MKPISPDLEAEWKKAKRLAYSALVGMPLAVLFMTSQINPSPDTGGENLMMLYILLIVAILSPAMFPFIERKHLRQFKSDSDTEMTPGTLYTTLSINKYALVAGTYIFGLVTFILSGDAGRVLYFYPIGIIWTYVYWPRREKFEQFLAKLE